MKVCLINNFYEPFVKGGAESVTKNLALAAQAAGHEVLVISAAAKQDRHQSRGLTRLYLSAPWLFWPEGKGRWQRLAKHLFSASLADAIKKELEQFKPDLVITGNLFGLGLKVLAVPAQLQLPHFHILHDVQLLHPSGLIHYGQEAMVDSWPAKFYQRLVRRYSRGVTAMISPSQWLLDWHAARQIVKADCLVRIDNPRPAPSADIKTKRGNQDLLFIGQLEEHKGLSVILAAYELLKGQGYHWHLVGSGSWSERLSEHSKQDFKLYGHLTAEEMQPILAKASVLLVPSLVWDNAPLVISEAWAVGLPVIGSDCGGVAEMIGDPDWLFATGSGAALAAKIQDFSADKLHYKKKQLPTWSAADYWTVLVSLLEERS